MEKECYEYGLKENVLEEMEKKELEGWKVESHSPIEQIYSKVVGTKVCYIKEMGKWSQKEKY